MARRNLSPEEVRIIFNSISRKLKITFHHKPLSQVFLRLKNHVLHNANLAFKILNPDIVRLFELFIQIEKWYTQIEEEAVSERCDILLESYYGYPENLPILLDDRDHLIRSLAIRGDNIIISTWKNTNAQIDELSHVSNPTVVGIYNLLTKRSTCWIENIPKINEKKWRSKDQLCRIPSWARYSRWLISRIYKEHLQSINWPAVITTIEGIENWFYSFINKNYHLHPGFARQKSNLVFCEKIHNVRNCILLNTPFRSDIVNFT